MNLYRHFPKEDTEMANRWILGIQPKSSHQGEDAYSKRFWE